QYQQITKPFFDAQVLRKVRIIPEIKGDYNTWQGYKCFYKEGRNLNEYKYTDLVHIWVWRKHNKYAWPRKGFHIHHKDHDKLNNDPKNLEEIKGKEHYKKHRNH
ncbi:HNH endonuclease, partial [candidate division KSB1 bacterium]